MGPVFLFWFFVHVCRTWTPAATTNSNNTNATTDAAPKTVRPKTTNRVPPVSTKCLAPSWNGVSLSLSIIAEKNMLTTRSSDSLIRFYYFYGYTYINNHSHRNIRTITTQDKWTFSYGLYTLSRQIHSLISPYSTPTHIENSSSSSTSWHSKIYVCGAGNQSPELTNYLTSKFIRH